MMILKAFFLSPLKRNRVLKEYQNFRCGTSLKFTEVKAFLQDHGHVVRDDVFALNMMLQWLFRGCIRKKGNSKMKVAFLSQRMSTLFKDWLCKNQTPSLDL